MTGDRPEKHSERMEIRLPYRMKRRFIDACAAGGDTPSGALRQAILDYCAQSAAAERHKPIQELVMTFLRNPLKTAGMGLASVAALAVFAAQPSMADEKVFKSFDENADGRLTPDEISDEVLNALDIDRSKSVTPNEFKTVTAMTSVTDVVKGLGDGASIREVEVRRTEIELSEFSTSIGVVSASEFIDLDADQAEVDAVVAALRRKVAEERAPKPT